MISIINVIIVLAACQSGAFIVVTTSLPGNGESIEYTISTRVATVTVYRYCVVGNVHNTEVISMVIIVHIPCAELRINIACGRSGAAGAIEKLNNIILPWGSRGYCLWIREDAAVNGLAGI